MKNDYLLSVIKDSGLYRVDPDGTVWTCKQMGGPTHVKGPWRRAEVAAGPKGRLQVRHHGKLVYAARLVWFWFNGPIPEDHEIGHQDNDVKNNQPGNLEPETRLVNQRKAERDGLVAPSRYPSETRRVAMKKWWSDRKRTHDSTVSKAS